MGGNYDLEKRPGGGHRYQKKTITLQVMHFGLHKRCAATDVFNELSRFQTRLLNPACEVSSWALAADEIIKVRCGLNLALRQQCTRAG